MAQSLELLLIQFLMPDNDARRQAEDQIKRLAKDPQVVPSLVQHLRTAKTPNVRQLAAVLLRKRITGHWAKLSPQMKQEVKQSLIESITVENSPPVRRASANVVSVVAKYAVPAGEWPDLLGFLFQCSQSAQEDHREVALILFSSLTETIGNSFRPYFTDLKALLLKCMQDESSSRVRVAALKAVGSFLEFASDGDDVVKFRDFVPSILDLSRKCLASGEEDVAILAFEIFDELIESPATLLGDSVKSIVQFSLEVSCNQTLEISTRHQAIQIVSWLAKYKNNILKKHKLVVPILQVMCPLLAESSDQDDDDDDLVTDRAAAEVIDTLAMNLPKHVFPTVFEFSSMYGQSPDLKFREAAVTALGVISEGCFDLMKEKLDPVLSIVLGGLRDPEKMVRGGSSFALGQFAEHLQPEILSHYQSFLPCVLNAIEDSSVDVKEKSYYALAAFCENMGEEIVAYLDPLMGKLMAALENSPRNLQETCMSAIGSVAAAAEQAFNPYAGRVLETMKFFMVLTNDEDLRARARSTELVGIVAMSVGKQGMEPILPAFIDAAIAGFGLEFSELREYTHGFFSNVAEILDDSFAQYLPRVMPLVFASCNLDDGSAVNIDESDEDVNDFGGVSSDDEAHDEPRIRNISVRTGVLDEKAAATQALGLFALHTKSSFAPYLEESLRIMDKHSGYFHEDVRLQAITGLKHILAAAHAIFQTHNDGTGKANEILDTVMNIYIKTMADDDDKEVVAQACLSIADIMKDYGYAAIQNYLSPLVDATLLLLTEKAACQQVEDESDDDDDVGHDEVLMDAVSDLLPAFAKCMGSHFEPVFAKLFEPLMKFAKARRPDQDRTMVVACLAEVAQDMGAPISAYVDRIMPLVLKELGSTHATNKRNAAFCVGELCKNGGETALKYFGDVLRGLNPLFGESETDLAVRDNAAGATARMILVHPELVPLNQVLPVLLRGLPLKEDQEESMAVYSCIYSLVLASNPQIIPHVPDLVRIFGQVVESPVEKVEVKAIVGRTFSHLISVYGDQLHPFISGLPPSQANALAAFASSTV
ncbi:ARM repeat superfamily protein [Raphanus sativus]|uniref:Uncharacterized protein LOC108842000 n=2 Tax=Raphanus sativus TaxID=3726 RepID=A0A6J0MD05_RAPSA|nr:uncharacterized protein LOC108842000 [Raphanus sativus]KAJ4874232.1 ARM repeat superfamily protein [Raphanus sativus]